MKFFTPFLIVFVFAAQMIFAGFDTPSKPAVAVVDVEQGYQSFLREIFKPTAPQNSPLAAKYFEIKTNRGSVINAYAVYDLKGKRLYSKTLDAGQAYVVLDGESLGNPADGVVIVRMQTNEGEVVNRYEILKLSGFSFYNSPKDHYLWLFNGPFCSKAICSYFETFTMKLRPM